MDADVSSGGDKASSSSASMTSKSAADYKHVQAVLRQLETGAQSLEQLWETRKLKLDLCLQLRMFEREALEVRTLTCTTADS